MSEKTIQLIAEAIISSNKVLQSLVDTLPREIVTKVNEVVAAAAPATVAPVPNVTTTAPVAAPISAPVPVAAPVIAAAPAAPVNLMPAPPVFAPAPVPVAAPAAVAGAPFSDTKGLIEYVMGSYKAMGPTKGAGIQSVLTQLGYGNINEVRPEHFGQLYAGVEALKAA